MVAAEVGVAGESEGEVEDVQNMASDQSEEVFIVVHMHRSLRQVVAFRFHS